MMLALRNSDPGAKKRMMDDEACHPELFSPIFIGAGRIFLLS